MPGLATALLHRAENLLLGEPLEGAGKRRFRRCVQRRPGPRPGLDSALRSVFPTDAASRRSHPSTMLGVPWAESKGMFAAAAGFQPGYGQNVTKSYVHTLHFYM